MLFKATSIQFYNLFYCSYNNIEEVFKCGCSFFFFPQGLLFLALLANGHSAFGPGSLKSKGFLHISSKSEKFLISAHLIL